MAGPLNIASVPVDLSDNQPRRNHHSGQTDLTANLLLGALSLIGATAQMREPVLTPVFSRHLNSGQHDPLPNATLYGLSPAQQTPFNTVDLGELAKKGRSGQQSDIGPATLLYILPPAQKLPFQNADLAVVRRNHHSGQSDRQDAGPSGLLYLLPPAQQTPFNVLDFAELARKGRSAQQTDLGVNLLTTTLAPSASASPFVPVDWPLVARRQLAQDTGSYANLLTTTLGVQGTQTTAQRTAPVITPVLSRRRPQADAQANLLTSTLAPVTSSSPFVPVDWPQLGRHDSVSGQFMGLSTIQVVAPAPFSLLDWPALSKRRDGQSDAPANLLTSTLGPVTSAAPFVPGDWTVVARRPIVQDTNVPNVIVTATLVAPIRPVDVGQVFRRKDGQADAQPNLLVSTLALPAPPPPFVPIDWPGTWRRTFNQFDVTASNLLILRTLTPPVVPTDFGQSAKRRDGQTDVPPNLLTLPVQSPAPFASIDWPSISRKAVPQDTQLNNSLIRIAPPAIAGSPAPTLVVSYDNLRIVITYDNPRFTVSDG
jgi:hypothetical protein